MMLTLLPTAALAAEVGQAVEGSKNEYGFATKAPESFDANSDVHPFGNRGSLDRVNLMPVKELGILLTSNSTGYVYNFDTSTVFDVFDRGEYYTQRGNFTSAHNAAATWSAGSNYRYAAGTAIDAKGSGRPDCVVYYGPKMDGKLGVEVRDLGESKLATDYITGTYKWMESARRYNAEGFVSVVGGDFDGDGKETFVLYDPDYKNIALREYSYDNGSGISFVKSYSLGSDGTLAQYFKKGGNPQPLNTIQGYTGANSEIVRNTAMVNLTAGDLNGDGKDELVVTVSLGDMYHEGTGWEKSSVVMVLSKGASGWEVSWSKQLDNVNIGQPNKQNKNEGWHMRAAASTVGDIDGDGKNEIFTVGLASDDNNDDDNFKDDGYMGVITEYTGSGCHIDDGDNYGQKGYWFAQNSDGNDTWVGEDKNSLEYMQPISVGLARLDGVGTKPYAFVRGQLFQFSGAGFTSVQIAENGQDHLMKDQKIMRQPVVGNFDGNIAGREQVFFAMSTGKDNNVTMGGYYYAPSDGGTKDGKTALDDAAGSYIDDIEGNTRTGLRSCRWNLNGGNISHAVLTAPDADQNDGMIAQFKSAEYLFNAPEVMAILGAAPYFEDLKDEYPESLGSTAFGSSSATGSSKSETSTNRAGAYVAFEQDISAFGLIDIASVEFETAYESEWNETVTVGTEFETAIDFDAGRESNQVVMMCTPVIVYNYVVQDKDNQSP